MATRRTGDFSFDHGAQYFTAGSDEFKKAIVGWRKAGIVSFALPHAVPAKDHALVIEYQPDPHGTPIRLSAECSDCRSAPVRSVPLGPSGSRLPLACLGSRVTGVRFSAPGAAVLRLISATIVTTHGADHCTRHP
jgi:hypothetical protein